MAVLSVNAIMEPFAALGVLSSGSNLALRTIIRRSWLSREARALSEARGLMVRSVLRRVGATREMLGEAEHNGDVALVSAESNAGRALGPLLSLVQWWRLACATWPTAQFIGKADDDVYLHPVSYTHLTLPTKRIV